MNLAMQRFNLILFVVNAKIKISIVRYFRRNSDVAIEISN